MHSARTVKNIFTVKTVLKLSRWQPQKTLYLFVGLMLQITTDNNDIHRQDWNSSMLTERLPFLILHVFSMEWDPF